MATSRRTCESCGALARVHALQGYRGAIPRYVSWCLACAPDHADCSAGKPRRDIFRWGVLLALIGVGLGLFSVLGEQTPWMKGGSSGFGWHQRVGVVVGAALLLIGALLRIDLLALFGGGLFLMAVTADWINLQHKPGIGWKQQTMLASSCILVCIGFWSTPELRRRLVNRRRSSEVPA